MPIFIDFTPLLELKISLNNLNEFFEKNEQHSGSKEMSKIGLTPPPSDGSWLDAGDIHVLWEDWKFENSVLFIYDTTTFDNKNIVGSSFDPNKSDLETVAEAIAKGKRLNIAFALGTMERSTTGVGGTQGHWFALVRSFNGSYLVMDSASNKDRLDDENVKNVVNYFEGLLKKFKK